MTPVIMTERMKQKGLEMNNQHFANEHNFIGKLLKILLYGLLQAFKRKGRIAQAAAASAKRHCQTPHSDAMPPLCVRAVNILSDQLPPDARFDCCESAFCVDAASWQRCHRTVPIIKIYGARIGDNGCVRDKVLVLVHGVYPYFFVSVPLLTPQNARFHALRIGTALERLLGRGAVHRIAPVVARSMYGWWPSASDTFLKIAVAEAQNIRRAADFVCRTVAGAAAFEAHIPHRLQFMMDFAVAGMETVRFEAAVCDATGVWHASPHRIVNRRDLCAKQALFARSPTAAGVFCAPFLDSLAAFTRRCTRASTAAPDACSAEKAAGEFTHQKDAESLFAPCSVFWAGGPRDRMLRFRESLQALISQAPKLPPSTAAAFSVETTSILTAFASVEAFFGANDFAAVAADQCPSSPSLPNSDAFIFSQEEVEDAQLASQNDQLLSDFWLASQREHADDDELVQLIGALYDKEEEEVTAANEQAPLDDEEDDLHFDADVFEIDSNLKQFLASPKVAVLQQQPSLDGLGEKQEAKAAAAAAALKEKNTNNKKFAAAATPIGKLASRLHANSEKKAVRLHFTGAKTAKLLLTSDEGVRTADCSKEQDQQEEAAISHGKAPSEAENGTSNYFIEKEVPKANCLETESNGSFEDEYTTIDDETVCHLDVDEGKNLPQDQIMQKTDFILNSKDNCVSDANDHGIANCSLGASSNDENPFQSNKPQPVAPVSKLHYSRRFFGIQRMPSASGFYRPAVLPPVADCNGASKHSACNSPPLVSTNHNPSSIQKDAQSPLLTPTGLKYTPVKSAQLSEAASQDSRSFYDLKVLAMEVFAGGAGERFSSVADDPMLCICYSVFDARSSYRTHAIKVGDGFVNAHHPDIDGGPIVVVNNEPELIAAFVAAMQHEDPDWILGYEVHNASWGYFIERCRKAYGMRDILYRLSRDFNRLTPPAQNHGNERLQTREADDCSDDEQQRNHPFSDDWSLRKTSIYHIAGRHMLNVWRIMQSEFALFSYAFENVYYHVFRRSTPRYAPKHLRMFWFNGVTQHRVFAYLATRVKANIKLLVDTEVATRTVEFCKFFGIDLFEVFSRGSQFKVEALMIRLAKLESFLAFTPTKLAVANMRSAESLPLVLEPVNRFYAEPVIVLDFQALYPSMIIAHNLCFTTFLCDAKEGAARSNEQPSTFGCGHATPLIDWSAFDVERDCLLTPSGAVFVQKHVREGILPKLLHEVVTSRIAIKQHMKITGDRVVRRRLDAFQQGLKLLANVTYGYTSAAYSGRMPMTLLADAIVETGRQTLERAIHFINSCAEWNATVVYGDTDSLFVSVPGRTWQEAVQIGEQMAAAVTATNPPPVRLKFEKVYCPSVLMAKKRYVGYKYESATAAAPVFEAKGIETVRRDTCPLTAKVMQKGLEILFRSNGNMAPLHDYLLDVWQRIHSHDITVDNFIFAKEVRSASATVRQAYKNLPPSALATARRFDADANDVVQHRERVPFLVVYNVNGSRLVDMVISPDKFIFGQHIINHDYYIRKQIIPAISRALPSQADTIAKWYEAFPKGACMMMSRCRGKIDAYFEAADCVLCGARIAAKDTAQFGVDVRPMKSVCVACAVGRNAWRLAYAQKELEVKLQQTHKTCSACAHSQTAERHVCEALYCPVFWKRHQLEHTFRCGEI